ncbi:alpha/beta fold hydrolase, partial [Patescibacteria group bacterium]|nr:alpha/beta fold hydrolase [Patescibacteria group bacterium]
MENKCRVIEIITPKKYLLNGLWFGGNKPKRAIIFIHGLTGSAFSGHKFITPLANENTAVITFSNRGHSKIARIKKLDERKKKGYTSENIGETHEVFTDCVDDIKGAVDFIKSQGVEKIYLAGHSTGCQKSIYYLSQKSRQKNIKGVILLCPVSDYSAITLFMKLKEL